MTTNWVQAATLLSLRLASVLQPLARRLSDSFAYNVALVNALLGRTPSPTKRKAPAAADPDTQYLDSPGFLPPQEKRRKPSPKDAVVDLTAED